MTGGPGRTWYRVWACGDPAQWRPALESGGPPTPAPAAPVQRSASCWKSWWWFPLLRRRVQIYWWAAHGSTGRRCPAAFWDCGRKKRNLALYWIDTRRRLFERKEGDWSWRFITAEWKTRRLDHFILTMRSLPKVIAEKYKLSTTFS